MTPDDDNDGVEVCRVQGIDSLVWFCHTDLHDPTHRVFKTLRAEQLLAGDPLDPQVRDRIREAVWDVTGGDDPYNEIVAAVLDALRPAAPGTPE